MGCQWSGSSGSPSAMTAARRTTRPGSCGTATTLPDTSSSTFDAYATGPTLETDSGEQLVTEVGGLDLFPPRAAIPMDDYIDSMTALGVDFSVLDRAAVVRRWPQFSCPAGRSHCSRSGPRSFRRLGARACCRRWRAGTARRFATGHAVTGLTDLGSRGVEVRSGDACLQLPSGCRLRRRMDERGPHRP